MRSPVAPCCLLYNFSNSFRFAFRLAVFVHPSAPWRSLLSTSAALLPLNTTWEVMESHGRLLRLQFLRFFPFRNTTNNTYLHWSETDKLKGVPLFVNKSRKAASTGRAVERWRQSKRGRRPEETPGTQKIIHLFRWRSIIKASLSSLQCFSMCSRFAAVVDRKAHWWYVFVNIIPIYFLPGKALYGSIFVSSSCHVIEVNPFIRAALLAGCYCCCQHLPEEIFPAVFFSERNEPKPYIQFESSVPRTMRRVEQFSSIIVNSCTSL